MDSEVPFVKKTDLQVRSTRWLVVNAEFPIEIGLLNIELYSVGSAVTAVQSLEVVALPDLSM